MMRFLCLLFLLSLCICPAQSDPQLQANQEAEKQFLKLDKELTNVYTQIEGLLKGDQRVRFQDAHKAWSEYRDAEVYARVTPHIGGLKAIEVDYSTRSELTRARIGILRQWMEQFSF